MSGDAVAHFGDHTGHFAARNERHRWLDLIEALHEQAVDEVHTGGGDSDSHLARADRNRWTVLDREIGDRTEAVAGNDTHVGRP